MSIEEGTVVTQLKREIECLREQLAFYDNIGQGCISSSHAISGPLAHVLYFNTPISMCYRQKIEEMIVCIPTPPSGEHTCPDYQPNAVQVKSLDDGITLKVTGAVEYYTDFCVDRLGAPMVAIGDEIVMDASLCGSYPQVYLEPPFDNTPAAKEEARPKRITLKCFNCDGDHHLKDCPLPRNFSKISASRQTFKDVSTPGSDKRYHVGMATDYGRKFVPGKISDKLRQALGVTGEEYPPYITRMRDLGYPPGYKLLQMTESLVLYGEEATGTSLVFGSQEIMYPGFNDQGIETVDMDLDEGETQAEEISQEPDYKKSDSCISYEFEEGEILEDVSEMKTKSQVQMEKPEPSGDVTEPAIQCDEKCEMETPEILTPPEQVDEPSKPRFSLDFPPGLVHDISECETSPKRWNALKKLLAEKKPRRKSKQFSFSLQ